MGMHDGIRVFVCIAGVALFAGCAEAQSQQSGDFSREQMSDKLQSLEREILGSPMRKRRTPFIRVTTPWPTCSAIRSQIS